MKGQNLCSHEMKELCQLPTSVYAKHWLAQIIALPQILMTYHPNIRCLDRRIFPIGLQPSPQEVVSPTIFSGGGWSPRDYPYIGCPGTTPM